MLVGFAALDGHSAARSNTQLAPQLQRSSTTNAVAFDRSERLRHGDRFKQCARSP
jgi:hypothetical protein